MPKKMDILELNEYEILELIAGYIEVDIYINIERFIIKRPS